LAGACVKVLGIVEENEIEPPQRLRHRAIFNPSAHDRREAFIQGCGVRNFQKLGIVQRSENHGG
jgi:hypothetical protein